MDLLQARAEFDSLAASTSRLLEAQSAAEASSKAYVRRLDHEAARELSGLKAIEAALDRQRESLRQFIGAALRFPPIDGREVLALRDMLITGIAVLGTADPSVARLAKALADALSPMLPPQSA
jgi:hypothetical protein